jgi:hypothetical protein
MQRRKSSLKKTLVTNISLAAIIVFVYFAAFTPFDVIRGPVMKGSTNGNNVALQIAVDDGSLIVPYMEMLDDFGVKATFFFSEQLYSRNDIIKQVLESGNGIGFIGSRDTGKRLVLYIGGGYSIPVMEYVSGKSVLRVSPSIDVEKLKAKGNWQQVLSENLSGDMFIYTSADDEMSDFQKVVQIVLNKGYTILKMDEML